MVLLTEDCLAHLGNLKTESARPVSKADEQTFCICTPRHCKRNMLRRGGGRGVGRGRRLYSNEQFHFQAVFL